MKAKDDIKSISYVKSHISDIVSQVKETGRPLYITQNGEAKVVLLDTEKYENLKEMANLIKLLSLGEKNIKSGEITDQEELFKEFDEKLEL